jgi:uncharacterized protein (UPF0179 family)
LAKGKEVITFVGEGQAAIGFRFVASQPPEVCVSCKLFRACMSRLSPGRTYEVIELKDKEHYCGLYEGNVRVAKVVQAPVEVLVKPHMAVEGAIIAFEREDCSKKCPLERECRPEWSKGGEKAKIKIEKVLGDVSEMAICGKKFRKVTALVFEPS